MPEQSLLTPELRARIGETSAPREVTVTPLLASRALEGYGGRQRSVADGEPASPFVLLGLEQDSGHEGPPTILPHGLLVSNEIRLERPLRVGETLLAQRSLQDIQERFGGRFGYSLVFRVGTEFR